MTHLTATATVSDGVDQGLVFLSNDDLDLLIPHFKAPSYVMCTGHLETQPNVLVTEVNGSDNHVQEDQR